FDRFRADDVMHARISLDNLLGQPFRLLFIVIELFIPNKHEESTDTSTSQFKGRPRKCRRWESWQGEGCPAASPARVIGRANERASEKCRGGRPAAERHRTRWKTARRAGKARHYRSRDGTPDRRFAESCFPDRARLGDAFGRNPVFDDHRA